MSFRHRHHLVNMLVSRRFLGKTRHWTSGQPFYLFARYLGKSATAVDQHVQGTSLKPRPFSEIPGPSSLPLLQGMWNFLPGGKYFRLDFLQVVRKIRDEHGDLCRLQIPGRPPTVFVFSTEDTRRIFQADGLYPTRGELDAMAHYRRSRGLGPGMAAAEGAVWKAYREMGQRVLGGPQAAMMYVHKNTEAADMFLHHLRQVRDQDGVVHGFEEHAKLWSFESMNMMALGRPVGIFQQNSVAEQLLKAAIDTFLCQNELNQRPPLWKYFKTKKYKQLETAADVSLGICREYVSHALQNPVPGSMLSVAASELNSPQGRDFVADVFTNLLFGSIDTTSNALTYLVHALAVHPECQEKARQEVLRLLPNRTDPVTPEAVSQMSYVKACLKEALRLHQVAVGIARVLSQEVVLSGYRVPRGVKCLIVSSVMSRDPDNFDSPDTFIPERWMRSSQQHQKPSMWSYLPFGHGPRMCIGRRFAELETWVTCVQLLRHCRIGTTTPHFEQVMKLTNVPDRPINITLTDL